MAINENVKDLVVNPARTRVVTLDLQKVIPVDTEGDEIYILNAAGTNLPKKGGGTVDPIYLREFKAGYARSSGFKIPPFTITPSNNTLQVSLDGSAFQAIELSSGAGLSGENVATDLQSKLNAVSGTNGYDLSFLNATVEFKNNKFLVVAGSVSNSYTGLGKSSVAVTSGASNDVSADLGFDYYHSSEVLSSSYPVETEVSVDYPGSGTTLQVVNTLGLSGGQAFMVTDGSNKEYFIADSVGIGTITLKSELDSAYSAGSVVQKIFERDPDGNLASPYDDVDSMVRFTLRAVANQIDFTI
jgi:hypothetical protein